MLVTLKRFTERKLKLKTPLSALYRQGKEDRVARWPGHGKLLKP